jgi:glycosyltransferase involved in cell wall biosynthesis
MRRESGLTVSCVMVTRDVPERMALLRQSVRDFHRQTYRPRELVVVAEAADAAGFGRVRAAVQSVSGEASVRFVEVAPGPTLGALRNRSMDEASGDLFCQWDDDDRHHPERLAVQVAELETGGYEAIYLREVVHYAALERVAYIATWAPTPYAGHPGTLLVRRSAGARYPEDGPFARRGEDGALHDLLAARAPVGAVQRMPHLFAYVHHGSNTWEQEHHARLAVGLSLSPALVARREAELRKGLTELALTDEPVEVRARDRVAFVLTPVSATVS